MKKFSVVALSLFISFGFILSASAPVKAATIEELQAQIKAMTAQLTPTVTSPYFTTTSFAQNPTLSLSYNNLREESSLSGEAILDIKADDYKDLIIYWIGLGLTDQNGKYVYANNSVRTFEAISNVTKETINYAFGGSNDVYRIKAGQTGRFQIRIKENPQTLFAGTYKFNVSSIGIATDSTDQNANYDFDSVKPPLTTSNAVPIVGERSPYITSVKPPEKSGNNATLYGVRFATGYLKNIVYINGVKKGSVVSRDGTSLVVPGTLLAEIYKMGNASYSIQIESPKYGKSNIVYTQTTGISIISPNGDIYYPNSSYRILWKPSSGIATVRLAYYAKGSSKGGYFAQGIPASQSYFDFDTGPSPLTGNFILEIQGLDSKNNVLATSKSEFSIQSTPTQPYITITSPDGGESYQVGAQMPIRFTTNLIDQQSPNGLSFQLYKKTNDSVGKTYIQNIVSNWVGGSPYNWTIPTSLSAGDYYIYIANQGIEGQATSVVDFSNNSFTITSPTTPSNLPTVTFYAKSAEGQAYNADRISVPAGTTIDFIYSSTNASRCNTYVNSSLMDSNDSGFTQGATSGTFASQPRFVGSIYTFTVTCSNASGQQDSKSIVLSAISTQPTINSLSQTSGPAGTQVTITGTGFTTIGNKVFFGNGLANSLINGSVYYNLTSSDKSHITFFAPASWVPECVTSSPACNYTNIVNKEGSYPVSVKNNLGTSNSVNFTLTSPAIQSTVHVDSPNGGEAPVEGSSQTIRWSSGGTDANQPVEIIIERKSPTDTQFWNIGTIATNQPGSGSYVWKVSSSDITGRSISGSQYKILIGRNLGAGTGPLDESDNYFTIAPSTVSTPSPTASILVNGKSEDTIFTDVKPVTANLSWSSTNATYCLFEKRILAKSGSVNVTIYQTTTYNITCTGAGGIVASSSAKIILQSVIPTTQPSPEPTSLSQSSLAAIQEALNRIIEAIKSLTR